MIAVVAARTAADVTVSVGYTCGVVVAGVVVAVVGVIICVVVILAIVVV